MPKLTTKTKKNYYAVHNGVKPGIYNSWKECKKNVSKFRGAVYKKFNTHSQALVFYKYGRNSKYNNESENKSAKK